MRLKHALRMLFNYLLHNPKLVIFAMAALVLVAHSYTNFDIDAAPAPDIFKTIDEERFPVVKPYDQKKTEIFIERRVQIPSNGSHIAVGIAMTSKGSNIDLNDPDSILRIPFMFSLLPTFCKTASFGYKYSLYVGHDHNDVLFSDEAAHELFKLTFHAVVAKHCTNKQTKIHDDKGNLETIHWSVDIDLHLIECNHQGHPTWAQNDALLAAYMDDCDYYYRITDDMVLMTSDWTARLIEQLASFDPPNMGVVGPTYREGNTDILTMDFTHRTHIDIFGFYYPRVFTDWFADDWISTCYGHARTVKVPGVVVMHTMQLGVRYVVHHEMAAMLDTEVALAKLVIAHYLSGSPHEPPKTFARLVSLALPPYRDPAFVAKMYGCVRYASLLKVVGPRWGVRVHVPRYPGDHPATKTTEWKRYQKLAELTVRRLRWLTVDIVYINITHVDTTIIMDIVRYLVVDDTRVEWFLVRDARMRPSPGEFSLLTRWMSTNQSATLLCLRDNRKYAGDEMFPSSLMAGHATNMRGVLASNKMTMGSSMKGFRNESEFLHKVLQPLFKYDVVCKDNCRTSSGLIANNDLFTGQFYDENDVPEVYEFTAKYADCILLRNTGFTEKAIRFSIANRPTFWSQDFHLAAINDIKTLLRPIGVKFIDNSFAKDCEMAGTCSTLQVIDNVNGMHPSEDDILSFVSVYRRNERLKQTAAVICTYPLIMCDLFEPLDKRVIMIATTRYEQGCEDAECWLDLNDSIRRSLKSPPGGGTPRGVLAANNLYDAEYMQHFTGQPVIVLPNYCSYLEETWNYYGVEKNTRPFLLTPIHSSPLYELFTSGLRNRLYVKYGDSPTKPTFESLRRVYPRYSFKDIVAHPGIIYIPYQISMISLTEHYRMNIPLFFPTRALLTEWHLRYSVVRHRTWDTLHGKVTNRSMIAPHNSTRHRYDPNDDTSTAAVSHWLRYADFYQWPHITYFGSLSDLAEKLTTVDLVEVSSRMSKHNAETRRYVVQRWSSIMEGFA